MYRPALVLLVALMAGCGKSGTTTAGGQLTGGAEPPPPPPAPPKNAEPPQLAPKHRFKTGIHEISRVAISDDGTRVVASSNGLGNKAVTEVWELRPEPKKVREVPGVHLAFSGDGRLFTRSAAKYGETEVVDALTGAVVSTLPVYLGFQAFTAPDRLIVVSFNRGAGGGPGSWSVRRYDARTGKADGGFEVPGPERAEIRGPVNGRREIVLGWRATSRVEVWDLGTGTKTRETTLADALPDGSWSNFEAAPDGKRVTAQRRLNKPVGVYDTSTGAEVATTGHQTTSTFVPTRNVLLGKDSWLEGGLQSRSGLRAYDLSGKGIVAILPGAYLFPAISADGRVAVTLVERVNPELLVWDLTRIP